MLLDEWSLEQMCFDQLSGLQKFLRSNVAKKVFFVKKVIGTKVV